MAKSRLVVAVAWCGLLTLIATPVIHAGKGGGGGKPGGGGPISNPALAYAERGSLFLMTADGSSKQELTSGSAGDPLPIWRSGGSTIGFLRHLNEESQCADLYEIGSDGTGLTLLHDFCSTPEAPFPGSEYGWDWSSDGTQMAFVSNYGTYSPNIYVLDLAATPHTLTDLTPGDGPDFEDRIIGLSWSPDGAQIAFQGYVGWTGGPFPGEDIHVIDVATGDISRLTSDSRPEKSPSWSSDGTRIAYLLDTGYPGPGHELMVMDADGSNSYSLGVFSQRNEDQPTWSPDDQFLSYVSTVTVKNKTSKELMKVGVTGGTPTNLTDSNRKDESEPNWNPGWDPNG